MLPMMCCSNKAKAPAARGGVCSERPAAGLENRQDFLHFFSWDGFFVLFCLVSSGEHCGELPSTPLHASLSAAQGARNLTATLQATSLLPGLHWEEKAAAALGLAHHQLFLRAPKGGTSLLGRETLRSISHSLPGPRAAPPARRRWVRTPARFVRSRAGRGVHRAPFLSSPVFCPHCIQLG